jgi:hypothetical protein
VDNACTIQVVHTAALRAMMYDIHPTSHKPEYILMNATPARIECRGSVDLPVVCARTGKVHVFQLKNVAYCPTSNWNILSWSSWADHLYEQGGRNREPKMETGRMDVGVPVTHSGKVVWGTREGGLFCLRVSGAKQDTAQVIEVAETEPESDTDDGSLSDGDQREPEQLNKLQEGAGNTPRGADLARKDQQSVSGEGADTAKAEQLLEGARVLATALQTAQKLHASSS